MEKNNKNEVIPIPVEKMVNIPDMGIELPFNKVLSLLDLFAEPGWTTLQEIWRVEKKAVIEDGMSLSNSEERRTLARGVYHKLVDLECLEGTIRYAHNVELGLVAPIE